MTRRTIRMAHELPMFLRACSLEEVYHVARALTDELVRRGLSAGLIADALADALLLDARLEHRQIFSADCGSDPNRELAERVQQEWWAEQDRAAHEES